MSFKVSNETKVGALAAIAITLLVLGYNFLKGKDLFTSTKVYYAIYDRVEGLTGSTAVTVNGYKVGQITKVALMPEENMRVKVTIEVFSDIEIGDSSIARITNADLFGSKAIELVLSGKPKLLESGSTLISETQPSLTSSLSDIAKPLKEKIESILVSLDSVVGGESGAHLRGTIANLDHITHNFKSTSDNLDKLVAEQSQKLDAIFGNVLSISNNLKNNNENINAVIANLRRVSDTLAASNIKQVVANAEATLKEVALITDKINKGEGSIGLLVNDKKLYNNLEQSASSLDALLKDMKEHPKRYVHFSIFGRKDKKENKK